MNKKYLPKGKWMAWDTGNGMSVCPADVSEALVPNVAAFQSEIVRLKPPSIPAYGTSIVGDREWDQRWEEIKAAARLIAAAPEMLEALRTVIAGEEIETSPLLMKIARIIAKVEGENRE